MPQIDLDGLNSRLYINELRSQSTSTIVVPSSTTLTVDTLALTKLEGNVTVAAGHSITVADATGLNVGGAQLKAGGVKAWETKSAHFTAEPGKSYMVDTTSAVINATLPASPNYGDTVIFLDMAGTFDTNVCCVLGNGEKIQRVASQDVDLDEEDAYVEFIYSGGTNGWLIGTHTTV
jgi:hypothetical protein